VSAEELKKAAEGVIPVNTQSSNEWALRNFRAWVEHRNTAAPEDPVPPNLLSCSDATILCKWVCSYVQETKKENGQPYPASTLRSLLAALQRTMHSNRVPFNIFDKADMRFRDLHMSLDTVCVALRKEGIGAQVKHAVVISLEHEELMWKEGALGVDSPASLLRATFYTVGLHFCLRGGQEHRDLKRTQFTRVPTDGYSGSTYYQYVENGSKNYQGRFNETGQPNKVGRAHAQPNSGTRCPVRILDLYLEKLPPGSTAFYMQPLQKLPTESSQPWFKNMPVGVNPLKNMMAKVSELAGVSVKYTNHSLRATSASRMFQSGVPEKIVAEVTGHKSMKALRQYERTTDQQFQAVGNSISCMEAFESEQVLPQSELKEEKVQDSKPDKAALVGESSPQHFWQLEQLHL
jgi:hypothetical protein